MRTIAISVLLLVLLGGCSGDDDDGGSGQGGSSGMSGGSSGMSGGSSGMTGGAGASGASGMGGSGGGSGASGGSGMGGSGGGGATSSAGQVVPPWDELCVLTFTEDFGVVDPFGDVEFTAAAGSRYLMAAPTGFSDVAIIYIGAEGIAEYEIDAAGDPPYTTTCSSGNPSQHAAVFHDTVVYADEELTMEVCTLAAGTHAPGSVGFAIAGDNIFTSSVYDVTFTGLESFCDGMDQGFVESTSVTVGSTTNTSISIATVLAP